MFIQQAPRPKECLPTRTARECEWWVPCKSPRRSSLPRCSGPLYNSWEHSEAAGSLNMNPVVRPDEADVKNSEDINLSTIWYISSALVCWQSIFANAMNLRVNYARAFKLKYGLKFMDTRSNDTEHDMISSEHLPYRTHTTYMRCVRFLKLYLYHNDQQWASHCPQDVEQRWRNEKKPGIWQVSCSVLYSSEPEEVELMVGPAEYCIKFQQRASIPCSILLFSGEIYIWGAAPDLYPICY